MKRRGLLAALAASTSVAVAGCAGQNQSFDLDAESAQVPESAYADGYSGQEPQSFSIDREFNAAGVNVEVSATTWVARYTNETIGSALFVASTPDESVAGQSVNPLVRADGAELIRQLLNQVDQQGIGGNGTDIQTDDIEEVGEETQTILGEEDVTVSKLETTVDADVAGSNGQSGSVEDVPVLVYIATVQHGDDVIVLVGIHPEAIDQSDQLLSMMGSVEH
ncbi:hypothetical protein J2744_002119 [Halorubrum trapanicum]|uniref:Prokaryotic membrane lipoprotein lipid attachment site profile n=1 Tax=Halorubrum trapanicum TaxID=29284 RepID=A0A8J7R8W5_9EURY|nr:DUF6517 family protein [Halorubrum trapanicum]MBP1902429.1 hypothetical protein [Halorubrum trapanicum]